MILFQMFWFIWHVCCAMACIKQNWLTQNRINGVCLTTGISETWSCYVVVPSIKNSMWTFLIALYASKLIANSCFSKTFIVFFLLLLLLPFINAKFETFLFVNAITLCTEMMLFLFSSSTSQYLCVHESSYSDFTQ